MCAPRPSPPTKRLLLAGLCLVAEFALLAVWQRNGYWDFSDGVYLVSARELLHGLKPYHAFAAAQPPMVYLVGAALLFLHDGLVAARVGLGVVNLITASLVGVSVWRLTGLREWSLISALASPLLPISLHEHAQLIPETLAAPLIMGAVLLCTRPHRTVLCALLLGLACACKVVFVIPALAVILASPSPRRLLVTFVVTAAGLALLSLLLFGTAEWREAVIAQLHVGSTPLHAAAGLLLQSAWNELPLVCLATAGLAAARQRMVAAERTLVAPMTAAAAAGMLLGLTVFKNGSYIDVLVVGEPPLLVLAACGAAQAWHEHRLHQAGVLIVSAWLAVQSMSILTSPGEPWAAKRPFAASGLSWIASPSTVDDLVARARDCPGDRAYSGAPYIALLANRRMPGDQPDTFIIARSPTDAAFARREAADVQRCPLP